MFHSALIIWDGDHQAGELGAVGLDPLLEWLGCFLAGLAVGLETGPDGKDPAFFSFFKKCLLSGSVTALSLNDRESQSAQCKVMQIFAL